MVKIPLGMNVALQDYRLQLVGSGFDPERYVQVLKKTGGFYVLWKLRE